MNDETYDDFPDWEALASCILRNGLPAGTKVHSTMPKKDPVFPMLLVTRVPANPIEPHQIDLAQIQVLVLGTGKGLVRQLAADARVVLHRAECQTYTVSLPEWPVGGFLAGVRDTTGLTWAPDPVTNRDGYLFGVSMSGHS